MRQDNTTCSLTTARLSAASKLENSASSTTTRPSNSTSQRTPICLKRRTLLTIYLQLAKPVLIAHVEVDEGSLATTNRRASLWKEIDDNKVQGLTAPPTGMALRMLRKTLEYLPSTTLLATTSLSLVRTPAMRRSLPSMLRRRMSWLPRIQDSGAWRLLFSKNAITARRWCWLERWCCSQLERWCWTGSGRWCWARCGR